ncbi:MAG: hypothetical protein QXX87_05855 [Candidatus Jordarchaeales archaeon]
MAARKYHLAVGILIFATFTALYYKWYLGIWSLTQVGETAFFHLRSITLRDIVWITVAFFLSLTGAEIADFDYAVTWMDHRDWLTHSAIIPSIPAIVVLLSTFNDTFMQEPRLGLSLLLAVIPLVLAAASHLIIDIFPSIPIEELAKKGKYVELAIRMADSVTRGMTLTEFNKRMSGGYLIHFWWSIKTEKGKKKRTLNEKETKTWLITNGLILTVVALTLLARYIILETQILPLLQITHTLPAIS